MPSGSALVARLKEKAAVLGLGTLGVAPVAPSDHAAALRRWLDRGLASSMTWMERTAIDSVDLTRRFPWAKSALVAAVPHLPYDGARDAQAGLVPHLARYALGPDYHLTLRARLTALMEFLGREAPGTTSRVYVDTGPILERELAARAGLGWFGKSTNLILRGGDSYVLLGEILTSALLPDEPAPTGAAPARPASTTVRPGRSSSRTSSTRTLHLVPDDRAPRPASGGRASAIWGRIFGCDICQEVCPWNRKIGRCRTRRSPPTPLERGSPRGGRPTRRRVVRGSFRRHRPGPDARRGWCATPSSWRPTRRRAGARRGGRGAPGRRSGGSIDGGGLRFVQPAAPPTAGASSGPCGSSATGTSPPRSRMCSMVLGLTARATPCYKPSSLENGRGVAQPGSALGSGPRGRRFKSSRPDHVSTLDEGDTGADPRSRCRESATAISPSGRRGTWA